MITMRIINWMSAWCNGTFSLIQYDVLSDIYAAVDTVHVARGWLSVQRNPIRDTSYELQAKRKASKPASGQTLEPAPQDTSEADDHQESERHRSCGLPPVQLQADDAAPLPLTFIEVKTK